MKVFSKMCMKRRIFTAQGKDYDNQGDTAPDSKRNSLVSNQECS